MNPKLKLGLYLAFTVGACFFGFFAYSNYKKLNTEESSAAKTTSLEVPALETRPSATTSKGYSKVVLFGGLFFFMVVGLGLLGGHDIASHFGNKALRLLYNDEGEGVKDPEYDVAEQEWANGHHLEAIRLMRDYLKKNPRQQHVAIRIAEIYEKDLQNHLAAALEYEEVLKHKLQPERWGWSAIHLCNLYFKLDKQDKAIALLQRICAEHSETPAAEKAAKRLAQLGIELPEDPAVKELADRLAAAEMPEESPESDPQPPPQGGLPPGFTLKKG